MANTTITSSIIGLEGRLKIQAFYDKYGSAKVSFIIEDEAITVNLGELKDVMDIIYQMRESQIKY